MDGKAWGEYSDIIETRLNSEGINLVAAADRNTVNATLGADEFQLVVSRLPIAPGFKAVYNLVSSSDKINALLQTLPLNASTFVHIVGFWYSGRPPFDFVVWNISAATSPWVPPTYAPTPADSLTMTSSDASTIHTEATIASIGVSIGEDSATTVPTTTSIASAMSDHSSSSSTSRSSTSSVIEPIVVDSNDASSTKPSGSLKLIGLAILAVKLIH